MLRILEVKVGTWTHFIFQAFKNDDTKDCRIVISLFECHKLYNMQQNKTYLIPSLFELMRHNRFQYGFNIAFYICT